MAFKVSEWTVCVRQIGSDCGTAEGAALDRSRGLRLRPAPVGVPLFLLLGARLCSLDLWFSLPRLSGRLWSRHRCSLRPRG